MKQCFILLELQKKKNRFIAHLMNILKTIVIVIRYSIVLWLEYLGIDYCFDFKDSSIILENNTHLVELKSKIQALEFEIREYENKLKKAHNDQKQILENKKNIGNLKL